MKDFYVFLLFIFLLGFGILIILDFILKVWIPYQEERRKIKMEISRNDDEEREYWKQVLRDFYISRIPIIGRIILKNGRKS